MNRKKYKSRLVNKTLNYNQELTDFVFSEATRQCHDLYELLGIEFHVDHIIPLNGHHVSGLHVWYNFQVLPAISNIKKSNTMMYVEAFSWIADIIFK